MDRIEKQCVKYTYLLSAPISPRSCRFRSYRFSHRFKTNTETLKSHCLEFVAKHLDEVQDTDDWDALMRDKQMLGEVAPLLFQTIQTLMRSRAAVAQHGTASHY